MSLLFWDVVQHMLVVFTDVSGRRISLFYNCQAVQEEYNLK